MTDAEPTFSIAMAAYNAAATIEPAIRSALAQTRRDFELIVVDDGSTDETAAIVEVQADPRIRLVRQENLGLAGARNTAVAHARGRYVSLLDSDDLWMPTYLERLGGALDADPAAGFAFASAWIFDDRTRRVRRAPAMAELRPPDPMPNTAAALLRELVERNFVFGLVTVRRAALERVGAFDASLRAAEDYDLWLRLAAAGYRAAFVPEPLALYRWRAGSLSGNELLMLRSVVAVLDKLAAEHDLPADVEAALAARRERLERLAQAEATGPSARVRARRLLARARRRVLADRIWHEQPPPEVAAVFPDLTTL